MATELWAARDGDGELWFFVSEPVFMGNMWSLADDADDESATCPIPLAMFPDLQPGEKCRVELRRVDESPRLVHGVFVPTGVVRECPKCTHTQTVVQWVDDGKCENCGEPTTAR